MLRFLAALALVSLATPGKGDEAAARDGVLMWRAWLCQQYAYYAKNETETQRLFQVGYEAGQRFVAAVSEGHLSPEEANSIVPLTVLMVLSGPSQEFVLGRVFESAASHVGDEIMKQSLDGAPLDIADWISAPEDLQVRGDLKLNQGNCELIR